MCQHGGRSVLCILYLLPQFAASLAHHHAIRIAVLSNGNCLLQICRFYKLGTTERTILVGFTEFR
ncbi:hypothetical protein LCM4577_32190 [Mesorhizobium sp. LCM 4577]|nr:hypothetical protein LCM4577_32190 [Mesorhizobium sp. LCM 4577]